jgi:hypothetical protein
MTRFASVTAFLLIIVAVATCVAPRPDGTPTPPRIDQSPASTQSHSTATAVLPSGGSPAPSVSASTTDPPALRDVHALMAETITNDRPMLRFAFNPDSLDGSWILDGNADDGFGTGRLYVVVTPRRGDLTAHPCGDPDFRQGGQCTELELPNGDRLVLRDRATGGGVTTVLAVLIHPDRSGITAEVSTMRIDLSVGPIGPEGPPPPVVTRAEPLYTAGELGALLVKIADRLRAAGTVPP